MALKRREFLQISAFAGLAATLPACGSGILDEPDVTAAGFGEAASGTVTMWCRGATQAGVQVVVDKFHTSQSRLHVNLTPVPDGQYVTKLATAIRSGDVPDIVDIDDINSMLFIFRGVFTDPPGWGRSPSSTSATSKASRTRGISFAPSETA